MIKNKNKKIEKIIKTIQERNLIYNKNFERGPSVYFYKKLLIIRKEENISKFFSDNYNIELLYATLVSWDMDSRRAKMNDFNIFSDNLLSLKDQFISFEKIINGTPTNHDIFLPYIENIFDNLDIMYSKCKLVANSKILHFLFPDICIPIDRNNTLKYFYGNIGESKKRFFEITNVVFEIMSRKIQWKKYLDDHLNISIPKIIDNAIILLPK